VTTQTQGCAGGPQPWPRGLGGAYPRRHIADCGGIVADVKPEEAERFYEETKTRPGCWPSSTRARRARPSGLVRLGYRPPTAS